PSWIWARPNPAGAQPWRNCSGRAWPPGRPPPWGREPRRWRSWPVAGWYRPPRPPRGGEGPDRRGDRVPLDSVRVLDLSQDFSLHTPGFAGYAGPAIRWIKRLAFDTVGGQEITTTLHVGTHLDAPAHFFSGGKDRKSVV